MKLLPPSDVVRQRASSFFRYRRHVRLGASSSKTRALYERVEDSLRKLSFANAQTQPFHNLVVLLDVRFLQIIQQTTSLLDHHQQPAPRMVILLMYLEMLGEFGDSLA